MGRLEPSSSLKLKTEKPEESLVKAIQEASPETTMKPRKKSVLDTPNKEDPCRISVTAAKRTEDVVQEKGDVVNVEILSYGWYSFACFKGVCLMKEVHAAAGKMGGSMFAVRGVDAKTVRMHETWMLRYYDKERHWPSRNHARRVSRVHGVSRTIADALWVRVQQPRRPGGTGLIEKVPEMPVKGT